MGRTTRANAGRGATTAAERKPTPVETIKVQWGIADLTEDMREVALGLADDDLRRIEVHSRGRFTVNPA